jgi:4'-phosphopantetheinyl transferase
VLKYYFVRDAKMSLASQLLKHYVVSKTTGLPWAATGLARGINQKPIFLAADGVSQPVHFNVSHQAGIVAVAAVSGYAGAGDGRADVGVDVVCVSERRDRDHQLIRTQGWAAFVDMHADVFGRAETTDLKRALLGAAPASEPARVDAALRRFYALWCLREAYVKMTGEALLASWLHDLEFQGFRATEPATAAALVQRADDPAATVIRSNEVLLHGQKVDDANICLRSLGQDYMTATAVRTPARKQDALGWELGPFETIDLDRILRHAQSAK